LYFSEIKAFTNYFLKTLVNAGSSGEFTDKKPDATDAIEAIKI